MSIRSVALDLTVQITTPENISFEYRLAGPFRRLPAMWLDFLFRMVVLGSLAIVLACSGIMSFLPGTGVLFIVGLQIGLFLATWFYGLTFEALMNGQTPGKRLLGLRVISVDGRPINAVQATIRNFVRAADLFPIVSLALIAPELSQVWVPTFLVSLVCMTCTVRQQRLGDLVAGTMVIIDEKSWYPRSAKLEDPRIASLCEFIPPSFQMSRTLAQTLALYVDRRAMLPEARRAELATTLAKPLLKKFDFRDDTSGDLLLCALYYRDFIRATAADDGVLSRDARLASPSKLSRASPLRNYPAKSQPILSELIPEANVGTIDERGQSE